MGSTQLPAEWQEDSLGLTQERFGFTLFVSLCVHAVLILGVGFTVASQSPSGTLDITLATFESELAPEDADFLAQANQQGSGTEAEALAPATDVLSRFSDTVIREVDDSPQQLASQPPPAEQQTIATDSATAVLRSEPADPADATTELNEPSPAEPDPVDEIASLQAQLDLHRQAYAKRPRRYTLTSASTKQDADALYLDSWRKRIEAVGNSNYPQEASASGTYGSLRLMVALDPDGSVRDMRVLRSSGEQVLDAAAMRIVQLAAPFDPFPGELRARVDVLEIIRTWQFHRGDTFSSF
ncbi:MAG TPA: energy transducer TonB [Pseudomonadaceae bacterium]|nr:energy transducer TonB [Pseudomonadaceae bacterium]